MRKIIWNDAWKFWKEGQAAAFVDLPYDAMISEQRDPKIQDGAASGYFPGGKYYYEKALPDGLSGQSVIIEFEGIYRNSEVFLNGHRIGGHRYGYTNFFVDLTPHLKDGENVLRVVADNSKTPNARWYTGSGIYRDVNLYVGGTSYFIPDGTRITTLSPAAIEVKAAIAEADGCDLKAAVYDRAGRLISETETAQPLFVMEVPGAKLWSAEHPNLYTLRLELRRDGRTVDREEIGFGMRTIEWNAKDGLLVNGKSVKLRGGCIHHDHGILGARTYAEAERRRISKLKSFGFNAIRSCHYPAGKALLRACDELGMYVVDEAFDVWHVSKNQYDYSLDFDDAWREDIDAMVAKDYNHPSVIMYSIGNEITEAGTPDGGRTAQLLAGELHRLDTRPVTAGLNILISCFGPKIERMKKNKEGIFGSQQFNELAAVMKKAEELYASLEPSEIAGCFRETFACLDIIGFNYGEKHLRRLHELMPDRVFLSTETFPSRIVENWERVETSPYLIGDFMWTAWDYLGEAGVGLPQYGQKQAQFSKAYPALTADCGAFDLLGEPEAQAYLNAIVWGKKKGPYLMVHPVDKHGQDVAMTQWRLTDAVRSWAWFPYVCAPARVDVYTTGKYVELYQNGIFVGKKEVENFACSFEVVCMSGNIKAVAYSAKGRKIGEDILYSDSAELFLRVGVEKGRAADGIRFCNIEICDADGTLAVMQDRPITVAVENGELLALGSADPQNTESFMRQTHTSYRGRLMAVIRPHPGCRIKVSGQGLAPVEREIRIRRRKI